MQFDTYTSAVPGPPGESIQSCLSCGRPGIVREASEGLVVVHVESSEMLPDGLLVAPVDFCPVPPIPFAHTNPAFI